MNRIATLMIGFALGGAVVGGAIYLSDTQDDSTSGPIEQPSVSGTPVEDSPTPASSGTDDPDASPIALRITPRRIADGEIRLPAAIEIGHGCDRGTEEISRRRFGGLRAHENEKVKHVPGTTDVSTGFPSRPNSRAKADNVPFDERDHSTKVAPAA